MADVTAALLPAGQLNGVTYRGLLLDGSEPRPQGPPGEILMQSNLVLLF